MVTDRWDFLYGADADFDGELYEPGSDAECYADPDYAKAVEGKVRTWKIDVAGQIREYKTLDTVRFMYYSSTGKLSGTVNGRFIEDLNEGEAGSDIEKEITNAINPAAPDGGYLDPAITDTKWTANALK